MSTFGIDLGTTNSLIGLHEIGYLSPLVPSCVNMETGEAGESQFDNVSAKRSFKVDISMGTEGIIPRTASQYVLRKLADTAYKDTGFYVKDVVISVPAYFSDSQRSATIEAATEAGLNVINLVNEPTAAAMYIAKDKKGLYVVYDLGGGTFDVSIIDSRFGVFDVQATDGRIIGGDNFDKLLSAHLIKEGHIPIHKMDKAKKAKLLHYVAKKKIELQKSRSNVAVDLSEFGGSSTDLTVEAYVQIMKIAFQDTIHCMKKLIENYIPTGERFEILLVGGSTHCPYLREWIEEECEKKPDDITYNPDKVVGQGAALYAKIAEDGKLGTAVSDVTKQLSIGLYDGTCQVIVPENSKIPLSMEKCFANPVYASTLLLDLYQGNSMFVKDNECIGKLCWDYSEPKQANQGQVIVKVSIDANGVIEFSANELLMQPKVVILDRNSSKEK